MTRSQVKLLVPKSQIKIATVGVITLFPAPAGRRRRKLDESSGLYYGFSSYQSGHLGDTFAILLSQFGIVSH